MEYKMGKQTYNDEAAEWRHGAPLCSLQNYFMENDLYPEKVHTTPTATRILYKYIV